MLVVETIARIRREYFVKGKPIKEIVRDVKVSRNTVRKVIRSQATAFTYDRRVQPMPKLGPWTAELERMLEANETKSKRERLTLLLISEALEGLGYGGGYDAVRRYAKAWRWRRSASTAQTYVPLVFSPGEAYQFDWSHEYVVLAGVTTKVKVAHVRLCHSRMFFVRAYPRESQEMVFDAHDRAFRLFQGACRRGILRWSHFVGQFGSAVKVYSVVIGGAKLVHPGGAKLVHLTLCGTRCWGVVPVVHRRDPRCFE